MPNTPFHGNTAAHAPVLHFRIPDPCGGQGIYVHRDEQVDKLYMVRFSRIHRSFFAGEEKTACSTLLVHAHYSHKNPGFCARLHIDCYILRVICRYSTGR